MTTKEERKPAYGRTKFHCPYCDVFTHQEWVKRIKIFFNGSNHGEFVDIYTTQCFDCRHFTVWYGEKIIDPFASDAPQADSGMPDSVKEIFDEARKVHEDSPRAAAALLRVALEELTTHLGETDGTLNARIRKLREKGLSPQAIKNLDTVRITANEGGAHSGQIDLTGADGKDIVNKLFGLVNHIVKTTITEPAEFEKIAQALPAEKIKGAEDSDKPKDKT
ncbi:MAG: DUF4145 domain-containing protein [Proteobacteria bacterium]|nr:DUF4145 domain-containing protein [Pseudomonadota bacterium]